MAARQPEGLPRPDTGPGVRTAELSLAYRPDNRWNGRLTAVVKSGAFSGEGSAWFTPGHVKETFVAALKTYPLSHSNPPVLEPGYRSEGLRISVRPHASLGTLLVQVDLATEIVAGMTLDQNLQHSVTVRFVAEYIALQVFAVGLALALDGSSESAVLLGRAE